MFCILSNRKTYRKIARENNVSVAEVKADMQSAIDYAYQNAPNDGITKAYQNRVPCNGEIPTVDEFLDYAKSKLKK
ncbi:sporulation initiation factor Spo0A C-terminal domain-containing protein [Tissierella carlieri]|uniref:sporulation initiation factor Spo0A C-terminal domain-containing protein n=1 Tax=Tissierella carlieri TaxID=689904 RepID=UPI003863F295